MLAIGAGCCTSFRTVPASTINEEQKNVDVAQYVQNAVVALVVGPEDDKTAYCAGVWVDNNTILTANHCAEVIGRTIFRVSEDLPYNAVGDAIAFVNFSDMSENGQLPEGTPWLGMVQKVDTGKDLATIHVLSVTSKHTIASIASGPLLAGQSVHVVGHTLGLPWTYTRGYAAATRAAEGPSIGDQSVIAKVLQVSAPVWVGNSGGGAFDSTGRLIGICSWVNTRGPNLSYFIHRDEILKFLEITPSKF